MLKKLKIIKQFLKTKNFYDQESLVKHQQQAIVKLLSHLNSDFYPKSLQLEDYPVINKSIFMRNFDKINTVNITEQEAYQIAIEGEKTRNFSKKKKKKN